MNPIRNLNILLFLCVVFVAFSAPDFVSANILGGVVKFNLATNFDKIGREQLSAVLVKNTSNIYFYVDGIWWDQQTPTVKQEILKNFDGLSLEFANNIYPKLTSVFGTEWNPGVDGDSKITVLFHEMKDGAAGYFRSADEYLRLQVPNSNEREMLYLSTAHINSPQLKVFLGHEFVHLITFNQKDRLFGVQEEVWLNEARADFASTILGYDDIYEGSNLQKRVRDFLASPSDPLTEWKDSKYDYAVANIFAQYLADHYSVAILTSSLHLKSVGIASLSEALIKIGAKENFSQIFTNWTIATLINDCSKGLNYCYLNSNLKNFKINPALNFLPLSGSSSLAVSNVIKNWSGTWQKFIGGNGDLTLNFESLQGLNFQVPYILIDKNNVSFLEFLELDGQQRGKITIKDFGSKFNSLTIMPSLQSKVTGFDGLELTYPYTFTASIAGTPSDEDTALIQYLLARIEDLKNQIAKLQGVSQGFGCVISDNLYVGLRGNQQVTCLQEFLKSQGDEIYPEGLVTGNFASLTKAAVIRFQAKYLIPTTGFVGILTRGKIDSLK